MLGWLKIIEYALGSRLCHPLQALVPGIVYTIVLAVPATLLIFSQSLKREVNSLLRNVQGKEIFLPAAN